MELLSLSYNRQRILTTWELYLVLAVLNCDFSKMNKISRIIYFEIIENFENPLFFSPLN